MPEAKKKTTDCNQKQPGFIHSRYADYALSDHGLHQCRVVSEAYPTMAWADR